MERLGAHADATGTTFAVYSGGEEVELCLFDEDGVERRVRLPHRTYGVWHGRVDGVGPGTRYGYRVHGPWDPWHGHRYNPAKLLLDPYARAIDGSLRLDDAAFGHRVPGEDDTVRDDRDSAPYAPRSVVVSDAFDWQGDAPPRVPWSDTVIYEAHVRGFTLQHADVPAEQRGTYAGLAHPAVIDHLRSLGVTTVELMPVHHFVSEPFLTRRGRANYWGYNSVGFFAPHAAYAASGSDGQQVGEFKSMVRALHAAGIEVVLDVVYNHTGEGGVDGPTLSWRGLDNTAYYRLRHGRNYDDVTGCGNTMDLRHPRTLQMVTDSLRYWVEEMHVDGFRFDLAPTLARRSDTFDPRSAFLAVVGQDPVLSQVKLIAEPWDVGPGGYQLGHFPPPWAEWNDRYRDAVRDVWLADNARKHGSGVRDLAYRLTGSSDVFGGSGRGPLSSVNFVTAHDGFALRDLVTYEHKHNENNGEDNRDGHDHNRSWNCGVEGPTDLPEVRSLRRRMMRNLLAILTLSTGVPMLTAGDEIGRTQDGNNNAYSVALPADADITSDNVANAARPAAYPVDWALDEEARDLLAWTQALLALRRDHPVLRQDEFFDGGPVRDDGVEHSPGDIAWFAPGGTEMTAEAWFDHDLRVLGMHLDAHATGDANDPASGRSLLVLVNTGPDEERFTLPGAPYATAYRSLLDTSYELPGATGPETPAGTSLVLTPHSIQVHASMR
ncbi:MAG: glycogen debranching protein GlgX [Sporichthyaceae bacterium]